jgi:hypothetical protein
MMAESKFTPGPYRVSNSFEGGDRELWIYSDTTYLGSVANSSMTPEEILANAELWADAPRMLDVLRNLLAYAEIPRSWDGIDEAEQAFTQAHEMLEKHCH